MKIIDFLEIENNINFWLFFLSVSFPNAYDETEDITLSEFIEEIYDIESAYNWSRTFTQYYKEVFNENDGYIDNPTSIIITTDTDDYIIQYHPGDVLYFRGNKGIACTGPHWKIHVLSFSDFASINQKAGFISILLLPIIYIDNSEIDAAYTLIQSLFDRLPIKQEHHDQIIKMIIVGVLI